MSTPLANLEADPPFHPVLRGLAWTVFVLLAWIVFELTANAALSVVVFSAKFGWDDLLTAVWLRRVDPRRQRAKACGWFFVASAFLKASIVAVVLMFAMAFCIPAQMGQPIEFVTAVIEAFVGFGLSAVTTWFAFFVAWRHGVKVWVDSAIHQARRDRRWPPQDYCRFNIAGPLLSSALALTAMPLIIAVVVGVFVPNECWDEGNHLSVDHRTLDDPSHVA